MREKNLGQQKLMRREDAIYAKEERFAHAARRRHTARLERLQLFVDCQPVDGIEFTASDARSNFAAQPDGPWLGNATLYAYLNTAIEDGAIRCVAKGRFVRVITHV